MDVSKRGKIVQSKVKNEAGLTEAQEGYARLIAWHPDWTLTDCYLAAYPNWQGSAQNAGKVASRIWAKSEVKRRVEALRDAFSAKCPLTRGEALTILGEVARDNTEATRLRIDAIRQLQSMIPAWQAEPAREIPQSIEVTIVTSDGRGLTAGHDGSPPIVVDVIDCDDDEG